MFGGDSDRGSFAFRLFIGVALTLLATGVGTYLLAVDRVRAGLAADGLRVLTAEVERFESTYRSDASRGEVSAFAAELADRSDVEGITLLDAKGRRVFHAGSGLASGLAAGHSDVFRGHLRMAQRVSRVYRLAMVRDASSVESSIRDLRANMMVLALPAIAIALLFFWLLSGRTLSARHRSAVRRATRDALTDLGNHRAFQEELSRAGALAERNGVDFALAVFDVDDFKFLNDRRGHQQGDEVLKAVARCLECARGSDRAFRTGGDEFAVIMPATSEADATAGAARLRRLMSEQGIAVSAGVSATRPAMRTAGTLREESDAALYEAKRRQAANPVAFSEFSDRAFIVTAEKEHAVRMLIQDRALDVALQPIWDLDSGFVLGFEGLARPHSHYELAGPAEAFDVAEQIGRVGDLDRLCVSRILERAHELPSNARLFINVHPANLDDDDDSGARWLLEEATRAGVEPKRIVVEVTERTGARLAAVVRSINQLRRLGFRVALDDVGAGNSGLEMMHSTTVDFVKVDRAIVSRAPEEVNARAVLAAITAFAAETGSYVIAEGIEDAAVLEFLRNLEVNVRGGIRGGQGYGLGRPAPDVDQALRGERPALVGSYSHGSLDRTAEGAGDDQVGPAVDDGHLIPR